MYLHRASNLHIESDGLFNITWNSTTVRSRTRLHYVSGCHEQGDSSVSDASVVFMVSDESNKVGQSDRPLSALSTGSTSTARTSMKISSPKLWESASPDRTL